MRTLLIAGLLGVVTNAMVTACCVYAAGIGPSHRVIAWDHGRGVTEAIVFSGPAKQMVEWDAGEPETMAGYRANMRTGAAEVGARPPRWSTIHSETWIRKLANERGQTVRTDIAYGWPLLSFRGGWCSGLAHGPGRELDFGPALPDLESTTINAIGTTTQREPRTMPLTPIASGVAANSALYGGAWWLLLYAPRVIKRSSRRRRGACLACGYDRRGIGAEAVCPECGDTSQERERQRPASATVVSAA